MGRRLKGIVTQKGQVWGEGSGLFMAQGSGSELGHTFGCFSFFMMAISRRMSSK